MNPPPSYQEILQLLNTTKKNEMKLMDEIDELKKQLETVQLQLKIKTDENQLFYTAYTNAKVTEFKLEKKLSKI